MASNVFTGEDFVPTDIANSDWSASFEIENPAESSTGNSQDAYPKPCTEAKRTDEMSNEKRNSSDNLRASTNRYQSERETHAYGQSAFSSRKYKGGNKEFTSYRNDRTKSDIPATGRYQNPKGHNGYDNPQNAGKYHRHYDKHKPQKWTDYQHPTGSSDGNKGSGADQSESNTAGEQASMGCVVDGRYMRKTSAQRSFPQKAAVSTNSRQNNYKGTSHHRDNEHRYGGRTYNQTFNPTRSPEASESHIASHHQAYRNGSATNVPYNSPRHAPQKNNFRRKEKYGGSHKLSNDDLNHSEENIYWQEDSVPEPTEPRNFNSKESSSAFKTDPLYSLPEMKDKSTQRDRLIQQLEKGESECMVCCELMRVRDQVWSCSSCYHVFHLRCIRKWGRSPAAIIPDCGWRCPTCQNVCEIVPYNYYCFCGKTKEPEVNRHYTPHSCGELCGKQRDDKNCNHRCNLLCHPGPCPSCSAIVNRSCACGKTKKTVPCNQVDPITCTFVCEKLLNCGCHKCPDQCHPGDCKPCSENINQNCFCGKNERTILCDPSTVGVGEYCCNMICNKTLSCSFHNCSFTCHTGPCPLCILLPNVVSSCPCGKHLLQELCAEGKAEQRTLCIDPIPVCEEKCEKVLLCGPKGSPHKCSIDCHTGECPPCPLSTSIKCQCSSTSKDIPCVEAASSMRIFQCERRCNRRKDCGRHKCLNHCCVNKEHKCELVCNKKLQCGLHHCQETCHGGKCPNCWNVSFDELRCHCGHAVLYPPIHCGTKPPECDQPCTRIHPCGHNLQHSCHSDETCPPCTVLTVKWCFGHHEQRSSVPCFLDGISCGKFCDKPLPCGRHKCRELCHERTCTKSNNQCIQLCEKLRVCGHPCAAPCHDGDCPDTSCKAKMNVSCPCGHRTDVATCCDDSTSYRLMSVSLLATKMQDIKAGESVNINDLLGKRSKGNRLVCNEECAIIERNKRLAVALQIQNPDLSCKPGAPSYSEFLKEETRKNQKFMSSVYDKFTELVQLAKQSKQKSRSFAFPPMNRDQRRIIHEMAEFFGCETQSYDEEPIKNVVITAFRDKSWLPFASITSVIQRESGLRKGPAPMISQSASKSSVQSALGEKREKTIDYFDFSG